MHIKWNQLFVSIFVSLGIGVLGGYLTKDNVVIYNELIKPPLAPPNWAFPIVWTILYILMGISAYIIYSSDSDIKEKRDALRVYGIQLVLNFIWSLIFLNKQAFLQAFLILLLLWFAIYIMIERFRAIHIRAGELQIPYLFWVMFAGYLNLAIICLNDK